MSTPTLTPPRQPLFSRLPVISHLKKSVGLQRGMLVVGVVLSGLFILTSIFAPLLAPYGYSQLSDASGSFPTQQAPGGKHLLGTTVGGYDVLSRVVWGSQTAVTVIIVSVAMSLFLGVALGLLSGYFGGWLDRILVVVADAIYAFPTLLLAIVISIVISRGQSSFWGGIFSCAFSITVVFVPQYFRVIRAETIRLKAEPFVESAKVLGASSMRIIGRHIFKNATRTLPLMFTLNASEAILTLAGLGFLGFGIEPTSAAEWGFDLNKALADTSSGIWWTGVFPGIAIVLTVLGLTLVGESINDLNDPRIRGRKRAGGGTSTPGTPSAPRTPSTPAEAGKP
ncbi:ABC transporter permease [Paenarthrobacter nicotinovorans]|uniref:ABC transporter permease n=1 Tax=Paenarthrobacter TaxID=1742992 RepID=UPI001665DB81|nr:ABC transporter permease [Paenarthrobacter nicotinovorans]MBP2396018.1 peptide/nickel transport system permease protein [Paenarthrobacter nicotinovorans]UKE97890.1 ABC transporter permease [Paenarthrobacter nicotinovorans]UKF02676.1 ABC transporter permease [Paenarthrobacter nicotinovorans]GGV20734.1 peptide ABC transporter permease [Paenarthrobacter nicotinovorans]